MTGRGEDGGLDLEPAPHRWEDLAPEPGIVKALEYAGERGGATDQNGKRGWSERFANGCAVAIADGFRTSRIGDSRSKRSVLPVSLEGGTEPLTPLGSSSSKRIDVTIVDPILGLEVGVSLKGMNFRDGSSGNFDKNVTRCLYETADEMRLVHEHLPHAFMAGVFFLPLDATTDKTDRAPSSFANSVLKLRERTTRLDVALAAHASRCDASFVALYSTGVDGYRLPLGVARFFDTDDHPPRRGRPKVEDTLDMAGLVDRIVTKAAHESNAVWGEPESD